MMILCLPVTMTHASLILTVNSFTTDLFDFTVSGTIDVSATIGGTSDSSLYIGDPGNTNWVLTNSVSPTLVENGTPDNTATGGTTSVFGSGNFIRIDFGSSLATGQSIDFDATFSSSNAFAPAQVDIADIILTAGYDTTTTFPDATTQVGDAIPEPTTMVTVLFGVVGLAIWKKRTQRA